MIYQLKLLIVKDKKFYSFLREQLNIRPRNIRLYELAFLHRSASVMLPDGSTVNNERIEYLGDAILDAVIADYLFRRFPKEREGFLTQMRSKIVNRVHLDSVANQMGLVNVLIAHVNKETLKKRICGDAFEALIGAMYLDKGYQKTHQYITKYILKHYVNLDQLANTETDFKSRLIEWGQKYRLQITFEAVEEHEEIDPDTTGFVVRVTVGDMPVGTGSGNSKKEAEQKAACQALTYISSSTEFSTDILDQYLECIKEH